MMFNSATNDLAEYQIMRELMGAAGGRAARFITPPPPSDADSLSGNGGERAKSHTDVALCSSFQNQANEQAAAERVHGSRTNRVDFRSFSAVSLRAEEL